MTAGAARKTAEPLRTLDVVPNSDRHDAIAPVDTDASVSRPAASNGDVEAKPDAREGGTTHELLESESAATGDSASRPKELPASPLVSGDPLLRGAAPTSDSPEPGPPKPPKASKPPAPPPPTDDKPIQVRTVTAPTGNEVTAPGVGGPGAGVATAGQPARRASRGAHVTAPRAVVAPTRPPDQPVATLRPTTVAPVPRLAGRRPRVRRVTRVVRHVDPWSVFKVAAAFSIIAYAIALVAGVLLWNVAYATGTIDNIERGMESTGWEVFELDGGEIFHNAWIGGLFGAVALTGLAVLVATLFNLITDLVGGIRLTVLEEEVVEKTASPMRRFATSTRRAAGPQSASGAQGAEARVQRVRGG